MNDLPRRLERAVDVDDLDRDDCGEDEIDQGEADKVVVRVYKEDEAAVDYDDDRDLSWRKPGAWLW